MIRSVAWDSGWSATVSVNGGKAQTIPVNDFDLVQQVHIPAGDDLVSFHYRPPHLLLASILSLGAIVLLLALLGVWLVRRRAATATPAPAAHDAVGAAAEESPEAVPERGRLSRGVGRRSAEGVGQGQEEFAVFGPPHPLDHEAGFGELALHSFGGELGTDLGQQVFALIEADGDARPR